MYHSHFSLREEPFGVTPDRRFFFRTGQHHEAIATLFYAIQQRRGFALLVGRAGLGKTTMRSCFKSSARTDSMVSATSCP